MAIDPVCGVEIDEVMADELGAERIVYGDRTYLFCCAYCRERFEADPARYLGPSEQRRGKGGPGPAGGRRQGDA